MIPLALVALIMTLFTLFPPPAYSKTKAQMRPCLDEIVSGSFASGATESSKDSEFAMVSWNIERGLRISEILHTFRGPLAADLYVLQEVDLHTRRAGYRHVAEDIARELNFNFVFGVEFEELAQGRSGQAAFHGQAVISRFPISRARVLRFRHQLHNWGPRWMPRWSWLQPRRGGRMALVVEIQRARETCVIYNTHLESKASDAGRTKQILEILDDIDQHYGLDTPIIIAGDLNTRKGADSPVLKQLETRGFRDVFQNSEGLLHTKVRSNRRKDWIFLRHLQFLNAGISKLTISDHYPLLVRVTASHLPDARSSESQTESGH